MRDKFLIVDGSSLVHRAFYAWPLLTNKKGVFTNAVYGLAIMMNKILETEKPQKAAICFDKSRITFRTAVYSQYKGTRSATPDELKPQFELAKTLMEKMNITWEEIENYEADDIIGTLARIASRDHEVFILTGDRDSFQLINEHTRVMLTKKGITDTEIWNKATLLEHYGLTPAEMIDLKALMGDTSDNIPGIKGVGEKTALKLLKEYGNLDNVLANAENIKANGLRNKVINGKEDALMSRKLAVIDCHMEEKFPELANLSRYEYNSLPLQENQPLTEFYKEMNFVSLLRSAPQATAPVQAKTAVSQEQNNPPAASDTDNTDGQQEIGGLFAKPQEQAVINSCIDFAALAADLREAANFAVCLHKNILAVQYRKDGKNEIAVSPLAAAAANTDMAKIFTDGSIKKTTYQGKALITALHKLNVKLQGVADDIELMAYLLNPVAGSYAPHALAAEYLNAQPINEKDYSAEEIAALNAGYIENLCSCLKEKLQENKLDKLYKDLEFPLSFVLAEMELNGITVDKSVLQKIDLELSAKEADLTAQIYDLAGRSFNINSPKQLGEVLFVEMGIPPVKKTKTGFSTNQEVLETLTEQYPIADLVLQYRSVSKLRSTYAVGLQSLIGADGKIHTTFNQTVTATGRLSSTEPNLQNIPIRDEMGRKLRLAFKPSPGNILVSADYSQIELRVLAHISNDKVLQKSFINNEDIHARTAAEVFGVDIKDVTKEQRRRAKAVNFGIVYGISDFGLAKDLKISRAEAKEYIEKYLAGYDGVRFYMKDIVENGKADGYVETLLGRKRWLPDLNNRNYNLRSFAERTALNTPIQGTAADIMKLAMLNSDRRLKREKLRAKMLLQVHDELIFDCPPEERSAVIKLVKEEMESAFALAVPMTADVKEGKDWYNMHAAE